MIEFMLLFALGFLTAAITGLLLAPVVHRRVVRFAEDRLKATMPLSPQEVRAQKDMARAFYAAETARATQDLKRERDKRTALAIRNDEIASEARRLVSENGELHNQIAEMNVEAADMRSTVRQVEQHLDRLKMTLTAVERDDMAKSGQIDTLVQRMDRAAADFDGMRIDLATRDTEVENLKSRMNVLREEREKLRSEMKNTGDRSREMEVRQMRAETKVRQLEAKLAKETSALADKENFIERRLSEIARLKLRVKSANAEAREAHRALHAAGLEIPEKQARAPSGKIAANDETSASKRMPAIDNLLDIDAGDLAEDVRHQATALSERLVQTRSTAQDDALRDELADIAAKMVVLTAANDGTGSQVANLLQQGSTGGKQGRVSLAARARAMLTPEEPA